MFKGFRKKVEKLIEHYKDGCFWDVIGLPPGISNVTRWRSAELVRRTAARSIVQRILNELILAVRDNSSRNNFMDSASEVISDVLADTEKLVEDKEKSMDEKIAELRKELEGPPRREIQMRHGMATCDLCRKTCSDWVEITIVKAGLTSLGVRKKTDVCERCLQGKEFFYVDRYGVVKFNEVDCPSFGTIMDEVRW